ncbi:MAG TPA: hypothetical protein VJ302_18985 [Blastocatellia bacterium]|nr:hypothetical protein [Blastocatellia bacterium]
MVATRLTPRLVIVLLVSQTFLVAGLIVCAKVGLIARQGYLELLIGLVFGAAARGMAVILFLRIADEYRSVRLTRLAWQALAVHAAIAYSRGIISSSLVNLLVENYYSSPLRGFLNHLLGSISSVFLLLGVIGILRGYRRAGLDPDLRARDYVVIAITVILFGGVLSFRAALDEGHSPWLINRILQPLDLCLIAAASIVSIVLYRYAASLSGGKMAEALGWLVIYGIGPGMLVLFLQVILPATAGAILFDLSPVGRLWTLLPWMLTLTAAVRAQITADVVAQMARLKLAGREKPFAA